MPKLQEDLLEVYNNLSEISDTVLGDQPSPVLVSFDTRMGCLSFKVLGKSLYLRQLNYYLLRPDKIKDAWLLPGDYDNLMSSFLKLIKSGRLIQDHVLVSPDYDGFQIYQTDPRNLSRGPQELGALVFVSGQGRWFTWRVKQKYKNVL